jgi:hypothetical protein
VCFLRSTGVRTSFKMAEQTKLNRADIICGYPAKKIRDFLGHARDGAFVDCDMIEVECFDDDAKRYFGDDAAAVVAELKKPSRLI